MSREEQNDIEKALNNNQPQAETPVSPSKRPSTAHVGSLIQKNPSNLYILGTNDFLGPDVLFEKVEAIGQGTECNIYAALFIFTNEEGEEEQRRCVLRSMRRSKHAKIPGGPDEDEDSEHTEDSEPVEALLTKGTESSNDCGLLKHMAYINHEGEIFAVFPYCELFLEKIIAELPALKTKDPLLFRAVLLHILSDIIEALTFMHTKGYAHRDLKPDNIAYYRGKLVFLDFGISCKLNSKTFFAGTPGYMHPYCSIDTKFSSTANNDIYAVGQILKTLLDVRPELIRMIKEKDPAAPQSLDALSEINIRQYNAFLDLERRKNEKVKEATEKHPEAGVAKRVKRSLSDIATDDALDFENKLLKIAISMTSLSPDRQPTLSEVQDAIAELKRQLETTLPSERTQEDVDQDIMDFYASHSSEGPFPAKPKRSPQEEQAPPSPEATRSMSSSIHRKDSFSVSFFGSRDSLSNSVRSPKNSDTPSADERSADGFDSSWMPPQAIQLKK